MTDENDKTQEQAAAPEQQPATAPAEPAKSFAVKQPQQKTINVVGGTVIAILVAIVLAQAIGDNNELSASELRPPGGPPNAQMQGPGGMGQGQMGPGQQGPGQQGQGQMGPGQQGQGPQGMEGPQSQGGPGNGPHGQDGQQRRDDGDNKPGERDEKQDKDKSSEADS